METPQQKLYPIKIKKLLLRDRIKISERSPYKDSSCTLKNRGKNY